MLKVVIVEDNALTLRSLVETIDWAALGCVVAGTAYDGEAGQKLILEQTPDIVITDIRMHKCDGLEMLEAVQGTVPDWKVIIITGYDEFQYASRAIKMAVFDYLLKPINYDEVVVTVRKAADSILSKRANDAALMRGDQLRKRAMLSSLLTNPAQRGQGVGAMFDEIGLSFGAYYVMTVQSSLEHTFTQAELNHLDGAIEAQKCSAVTLLLYDTVVIFAMRPNSDAIWKTEAKALIRYMTDNVTSPIHIGVSDLSTSLHMVNQTYQQARQAMWEAVMDESPANFLFFDDLQEANRPREGAAKLNRRIEELIHRGDLSDEAAEAASHELVALSGHQYSHLRALTVTYMLGLTKHVLSATSPSMPSPDTDATLFEAWFVTSKMDVSQCLTRLHRTLRTMQQQPQQSLLVKNAIQLINLRALEGVQLNEVAEKLCVSSNYLSSLISRETGITFHEHVMNGKMAVARSMLADPRIRVEDVAYAVGYGSYASFYSAFKRSERMTPTEYRNRMVSL